MLVWMDLEMTGLNPATDQIIEIATLATDWELNIISQGPELAIHWPTQVFEQMDDWCIEHHGASGLTNRCLNSSISLKQAEQDTLTWLQSCVPKGVTPLCGNSIHQDRRFLYKHMPELESYFHYRNIDVSTLKELTKRWYPAASPYVKTNKHTALEDIVESIEELRHYKKQYFI